MPKHTEAEKRKNALKRAGIKVFGQLSTIEEFGTSKRKRMTVKEALKIAKERAKKKKK